jgi:tetratricopeptide (TPR) repeat protein
MAKSTLVQAEESYSENRLQEAKEASEKALEYKDDYIAAWLLLTSVHVQQGNFALAVNSAEQAVALEPDDSDAQFMLGLSRFAVGDFGQAVNPFSRASD